MLRKPMRAHAVKAALGDLPNSTFYDMIAAGIIPKGAKLNPHGRTVIWWEDEIESIQEAIAHRAAQDDAEKEAVKHRVAQHAERRAIERQADQRRAPADGEAAA